jgi:superoxide reductase
MENRRTFLKTSAIAASFIALGRAVPSKASEFVFSGIIYTKDNPGKWGKKVGSHLPVISSNQGKITIETKHPMSEQHYIIRHTLVLADGSVMGGKTFYPDTKKAVSEYTLPAGYSGKIYATSFCNLHDFWLNEAFV